MKTRLILLWLALFATCATHQPNAAAPATDAGTNRFEALTLHQALALAERLQPELAEGQALVDAAQARVAQAGALPNPEVAARLESAPIRRDATGQGEYLAGFSQAIPLGGRLNAARQAERLEREKRAREFEVRRRHLHQKVHAAFATALYQEQAFEMQTELSGSAEKLVAVTKARLEAGDARQEELARAEMELIRARVEFKRSEALREQAMTALKTAIGDPSLPVKSLSGSLDGIFEIPALETLSANLAAAPEMMLASAEIRERQARIELAKAERIPDINVELLYRRLQASRENAFDLGFSISLPVFDRNQGRVREARAEAAAADARSRAVKNAVSLRLHEAHAQLTTALANARALETEILPRAEIVLKAAEARFAAGDLDLDELLRVRRDWAAVQLAHLEALRDVMQAWGELKPLAGLN